MNTSLEKEFICSLVLLDLSQLGIGSLLIATKKLLKVPPFDNSVLPSKDMGFQGVIINNHLSCNLFEDV